MLYALSQERSSSAAGGTDVPIHKSGPECEADLVYSLWLFLFISYLLGRGTVDIISFDVPW